jgi:two-component system phosphate regulon response regulator PhoB/two-component system alkaline phosphatase synthesis response regulator PhoP
MADEYILMIDDDEDMGVFVADVLQRFGITVRWAKDGTTGLFYIHQGIPAMVLLDLCMPHATGWDMIKRLRSEPETRGIPVIVVTSFPIDARLLDSLDLTADRIVRKSEITERLPVVVNTIIEEKHAKTAH